MQHHSGTWKNNQQSMLGYTAQHHHCMASGAQKKQSTINVRLRWKKPGGWHSIIIAMKNHCDEVGGVQGPEHTVTVLRKT